jgi:hypothetical protein
MERYRSSQMTNTPNIGESSKCSSFAVVSTGRSGGSIHFEKFGEYLSLLSLATCHLLAGDADQANMVVNTPGNCRTVRR